jgi:hypothetical protein
MKFMKLLFFFSFYCSAVQMYVDQQIPKLRMKKCLRTILVLFTIIISSFQVPASAQEKIEKNPSTELISESAPVVFGKKDDGYPEKLKVRGVITELSFAQAYCGVIAWSGTIKVKLLDKIEGYPYENVFIVVPCFLDPNNENKYLKKMVQVDVFKLYDDYNQYKKKKPCYFEIITNTLNSNNIPFYCSRTGQEELLNGREQRRPLPK